MARIPFSEWRPDVDDLNAPYTRIMRNVIPRTDGFGPVSEVEPFTSALPAACRGAWLAQAEDGSVFLFAGTVNNLYLLNNSTLEWTEVSKGGADYTDLSSDANWVFAQFGNFVIATQRNTVMQVYDISSSSAFADLAGTPPQAGWLAVVGPFLVACDLLDDPYNVHWSAINSAVGWTPGTDRSDSQPMADGGRVRAVVEMAGDVGLILQEGAARRMLWQPGSATVFKIDKFPTTPGTYCPYSVTVAQGGAYYLSTRGFLRLGPDGSEMPIGEERVNRTFFGQHGAAAPVDVREFAYDEAYPRLVMGVTDPTKNLIVWAYKADETQTEAFDRALIYHTALNQWGNFIVAGEWLSSLSRPGLTVEALDAVAPGAVTISNAINNGSGLIRLTVTSTTGWTTGDVKTISAVGGVTNANGTFAITVINGTTIDLQGSTFAGVYTSGGVVGGSIDDIAFTLDSIATSSLPDVAAFTTAHKVGFFSGDPLEAVLESAEQGLDGARMNINGLRPVTDAETVYASIIKRDKLAGTSEEGDESLMDDDGYCPLLEEARYARGRLRIPEATDWTFANGFSPDWRKAGEL